MSTATSKILVAVKKSGRRPVELNGGVKREGVLGSEEHRRRKTSDGPSERADPLDVPTCCKFFVGPVPW
jgi:hypothetical protein